MLEIVLQFFYLFYWTLTFLSRLSIFSKFKSSRCSVSIFFSYYRINDMCLIIADSSIFFIKLIHFFASILLVFVPASLRFILISWSYPWFMPELMSQRTIILSILSMFYDLLSQSTICFCFALKLLANYNKLLLLNIPKWIWILFIHFLRCSNRWNITSSFGWVHRKI